ncbi:MAG: ABC transporter permease [Caldilineaceae bacterium SB0662_bin_9]|uniref:ABC transporter permease n=1 Tax=Caldilineaceae bacterium SB0662_bin_9 TaxID=2605258 RepID=A0A6B1DP64_9CHLR|nr:ABC transporter permease [Caldilineaceae bacterium SB0662_bin_9]
MFRRTLRAFGSQPQGVIGLGLLLVWLILALSATQLVPYDPLEQGLPPARAGDSPVRQAPSSLYWFGTDELGRDVLSRVLAGAHISLALGFISVSIGLVAGTALGLVAGFYGGWVDGIVMRAMDALLAFPGILLALVVIAALGTSIQNVMIAVGIAIVPQYARLVRSLCLTIRELAYVEAAHVVGSGPVRLIFRHFLPNIVPPLIVLSTLQIGQAIIYGSALSFLGMGAQPPTPEWGLIAAKGRDFFRKAWWISTFPSLAILSVVLAFNLLGDGLRGLLDPRMRMVRAAGHQNS